MQLVSPMGRESNWLNIVGISSNMALTGLCQFAANGSSIHNLRPSDRPYQCLQHLNNPTQGSEGLGEPEAPSYVSVSGIESKYDNVKKALVHLGAWPPPPSAGRQ